MSNATEHQYNSCGNGRPADRYVEPAGTAAAAVDFLGKGRVCLTNSYHGALWAQMLEKPVIIVDGWSTKFYRLPLQQAVVQVSFEEVRTSLKSLAAEAIERATCYAGELAGLLDASRHSNMDFAQTVEEVLLDRGILY
jgi:exopolysaccharide biosynthesis predicted pyruvyltransferase EpsI